MKKKYKLNNNFSLKDSKFYLILIGLLATVWFLIRVIPKPSRAKYPCMQAAAPFMSSFIIYILAIGSTYLSFNRFKKYRALSKHSLAALFLIISVSSFMVFTFHDSKEIIANSFKVTTNTFPVNSNEPIGDAKGVFPGRVVWVFNEEATNENYTPLAGSDDWWYDETNVDESVITSMLSSSLKKYSNTQSSSEAWVNIFKGFNQSHGNGIVGYTPGEKIAIKINLTNQCCTDESRMDATPQLLNAVLTELTQHAGVSQSDIVLGDPYREFRQEYKDIVKSKFPNVYYVDGSGGDGINQTVPSSTSVLEFSDGQYTSTLPQHYIDAKYFINIPCLKTHDDGGVTLIAKNHQGSYLPLGNQPQNQSAYTMHYSLASQSRGDGNYRHTVDYMGHEHTGGKALIYIIDGIWGGDSWQGFINKYKSAPFNNDYPNSILIGQDPVALESVCYDILFEESLQDVSKGQYPITYKTEVADHLKQCASSVYWPSGISYDPEGDGTSIGSLGVFEHWNNATDKKYSRNLGTGTGIELLIVDDNESEGATLRIHKTTEDILIDGQSDDVDWNNATWSAIDQVWIPFGSTMTDGDFSGRFKTLWDEEYLYLLVEVEDNQLSDDTVDPLSNWWNDDCLEIFIDEDGSKGDHERNCNAFAYHLSLSFDAIDLNSAGTGINYKDHLIVDMDTIAENTYLWEMAIKLYDDSYSHANPDLSRLTLSEDKVMGIAVAYCDNDETSGRENFIGSVPLTAATNNIMYQSADYFKEARLISSTNNFPVIVDQVFNLDENSEQYHLIGKVLASDPEGSALTYSIKSKNVNAVIIDPNNGNLILVDSAQIDYEALKMVELLVEVSDGDLVSSANVIINIIDVLEGSSPTLITGRQEEPFLIYPNPSQGDFYISASNTNTSINNVYLFNTQGQLIYTLPDNINSNTERIKLLSLKQGVYFVMFDVDGIRFSQRIMVTP